MGVNQGETETNYLHQPQSSSSRSGRMVWTRSIGEMMCCNHQPLKDKYCRDIYNVGESADGDNNLM